jgi:uncharacterized SAM-dependent methyltransferase
MEKNMMNSETNLRNFWLTKKYEKNILRVIEWAHRQDLKIQNLTKKNIYEALQTYMRDASHS